MEQWKAKREVLVTKQTCVQTQTDDFNPSTDETTQTEQLNSYAQAINIPTVLTKKRAIDTDKMHIYLWYATNIENNPPILKIPAKNGQAVQLYEVRTTE
jgi:hypothetical protein